MSYPPPGQQNNPYGTPPQQPYGAPAGGGYGTPQPQQPTPQPQPGYGYPQQQPAPAPAPTAPMPQQGQYGYPQPQSGYPQQGFPAPAPGPQPGGYASWGSRLGAMVIDGLIAGIVPGILMAVGSAKLTTAALNGTSTSTGLILYAAGLVLLIAALAFLGMLEGGSGQTPGKKALHIRTVNLYDRQPSGSGLGVCRWFAKSLNVGIGFLWPLWDERSQHWADKICNTVVVRDM